MMIIVMIFQVHLLYLLSCLLSEQPAPAKGPWRIIKPSGIVMNSTSLTTKDLTQGIDDVLLAKVYVDQMDF